MTIMANAMRLVDAALGTQGCFLVWSAGDHAGSVSGSGTTADPEDRDTWLKQASVSPPRLAVMAPDGALLLPLTTEHRTAALVFPLGVSPPGVLTDAFVALAEELLASGETDAESAIAYQALSEIGVQIQATQGDPADTVTLIVDRARELLRGDVAWLALVDASSNRISVRHATGTVTAGFHAMQSALGAGIGGAALAKGLTVAVRTGGGYDAALNNVLSAEGVVSTLGAPLMNDGAVIGALYVGNRSTIEYSPATIALLEALAVQVSIAIENFRLYRASSDAAQMLDANRRLTLASLSGAGRDGVAVELARLMRRDLAVVTADSDIERCPGDPSAAVEIIGPEQLEAWGTALIRPLSAGDVALGEVHVLGAVPLSDLQRNMFEHGVMIIALEIVKQQAGLEAEWRLQGELLGELLQSGASPSDGLRLRAERAAVPIDLARRVVVLHPGHDVDTRMLLDLVQRTILRGGLLREGLVAERADRVIVALAEDEDGRGPQRCVAMFQQEAEKSGVPFSAGMSNARADLSVALREAEAALALALSSHGTQLAFISYEDLGPLRFLLDAPDSTEMVALARHYLAPLAYQDRRRRSALLPTLRAFLDAGGHHPTTADRCHIHISTLKYRLGRITGLLGCSLGDPQVRFELGLAFAVLRILEMLNIDPFASEAG